jgi:hypothetical protein
MKQLTAVLAMLLTLSSPFKASSDEKKGAFKVPFHFSRNVIVLDIKVANRPASLILDTGAELSLLDSKFAGIKLSNSTTKNNNGSGIVSTAMARIGSLCISDFCLNNRIMGITDFSLVSSTLKTEIDGSIGEDILKEFTRVSIDYKSSTVEFQK